MDTSIGSLSRVRECSPILEHLTVDFAIVGDQVYLSSAVQQFHPVSKSSWFNAVLTSNLLIMSITTVHRERRGEREFQYFKKKQRIPLPLLLVKVCVKKRSKNNKLEFSQRCSHLFQIRTWSPSRSVHPSLEWSDCGWSIC
jgi:hypothetical protein